MIPSQLRDIPQWILWRSETRDGKATKVPCDEHGRPAAVNDPASWHTYEDAVALAKEKGYGVGFCFTEDDPFFGIDLDNCWPNLSDEAKEIIGKLPTYAEVSPSGKGIKFIGRGVKSMPSRSKTLKVPGLSALEVYDRDRFFTITGNLWGLTDEIEECQEGLDWIMEKWLPMPGRAEAFEATPGAPLALAVGDEEVTERMFRFATGKRARRLWEGDLTDYKHPESGDTDQSKADLALCGFIAFACGGPHVEQIERIFSASALGQRAKWAERPDYRERTIRECLSGRSDYYTPPAPVDFDWADALADEGKHATRPPTSEHTPRVLDFPIPEQGLIRKVVDLVGPYTEASDESLALSMLAIMSAVVGWNCYFQWGENPEPCVLFIVITGGSATDKKTTAMRSVESVWKDAAEGQLWRSPSSSTSHISGRAIIEEAMGGIGIFHVKEPKVTADPSEPEYVDQMHERDKHIRACEAKLEDPPPVVLVWDEFGKLLGVGDKEWQKDTRTQLLALYNGRHSGIKTTGRDGITVPGGKVSMALLGTMTTDELQRTLNAQQSADGLIGRILFATPGNRKPSLAFPPARDAAYDARKADVIQSIRSFMERLEAGGTRHGYEGWEPDARAWFEDWYTRTRSTAEGIRASMFARAQVSAVKIACLLEMAEDDGSGWGGTILLRHIQQAVNIVESSWAVAEGAVETQIQAQEDRYVEAMHAYCIEHGPTPISVLVRKGVAKEPGDRTPTQAERRKWLVESKRFEPISGGSGKLLAAITSPTE